MEKYFFSTEGLEVAAHAQKISTLVKEPLLENNYLELRELVETLSYTYESEIWLIDLDGNTIVESSNHPDSVHILEASEINSVLDGNVVTKQISGIDSRSLSYVVPVTKSDRRNDSFGEEILDKETIIGAVVINSPLGKINTIMANIVRISFSAVIISIPIAFSAGFIMSKIISRPFEKMINVARNISRGDFNQRVDYDKNDDVSELVTTFNYAISKITESLEEKNRLVHLQNDLLSNITHEFRSPLTSLRGFLELLIDGKISNEAKINYYQIMMDDTLHLNRLVGDLLELASLQSGQIKLIRSTVQLERLFIWLSDYYHLDTKAHQINLDLVQPNQPMLPLYIDKDRIHQVLINLVDNAIRYSPKNGTITVFTRIDKKSNHLFFFIKDEGVGIESEDLKHIWEKFYKADAARTRSTNGSGIGLAVVKQIIDMHNGHVFVKSILGKGSTFGFSLPIVHESSD